MQVLINLSGTFHLDGIPPASHGALQFRMTFDVDADGMLNVSVQDYKSTGKSNHTVEGI